MPDATKKTPKKKRKLGIPTGNAGEYLVMGELLRRGFDAQLADRNTKGYDILVATEPGAPVCTKNWICNSGEVFSLGCQRRRLLTAQSEIIAGVVAKSE